MVLLLILYFFIIVSLVLIHLTNPPKSHFFTSLFLRCELDTFYKCWQISLIVTMFVLCFIKKCPFMFIFLQLNMLCLLLIYTTIFTILSYTIVYIIKLDYKHFSFNIRKSLCTVLIAIMIGVLQNLILLDLSFFSFISP